MALSEEQTGPLLGAIDQGTSSSRFLVFSAPTGRLVTSHQIELMQTFPKEGWVEMDPMQILESVKICIIEACQELVKMGFGCANIKAVGITNQRETTIVWDRLTGHPLYPAIVWLDCRSAGLAEKVVEKTPSKRADHFQSVSGLPIHPYFSALKLKWLIDNVKSVREAVRKGQALAGTIDTWLIWNLSGGVNGKNGAKFVTDVTNASRTGLMNLKTCQWDGELCKFYGIPQEILADIKSSAEIYGQISLGAPEGHTKHPLEGVPLAGCLGDQQAALVGQGCLSAGLAKNTYGTGCFLLYNTGTKAVISQHGLLTTVAFQLGPEKPVFYALEGSVAIAGACVRWLRDNLRIIKSSDEIEALAKSVQDCGGVYFVPAFTGLYAPYWHSAARGLICGLSQYSSCGHVARATLEAVCFQTKEILDAMKKDCGRSVAVLKCDGGMTKNRLLLQLQADLLGFKVTKSQMTEATALGAAIAAGLAPGVGVWDVTREGRANGPLTEEFQPTISAQDRERRYRRWKEAVRRSMNWTNVDSLPANDLLTDTKFLNNTDLRTQGLWLFTALASGMVLGYCIRKFL